MLKYCFVLDIHWRHKHTTEKAKEINIMSEQNDKRDL